MPKEIPEEIKTVFHLTPNMPKVVDSHTVLEAFRQIALGLLSLDLRTRRFTKESFFLVHTYIHQSDTHVIAPAPVH